MTKQELGELIISQENVMYHVGMSLLRNEADVQDAVQTAIVKAFEKYDGLRKEQYARTWLIRILINECRDMLRRRRYMDPEEAVPEQIYEETFADYAPLYQALLGLPEEMRLVVTMYYADEFSIREIAQVLHVPEGTVKSRLARARAQLKSELDHMEVCYG